MKILIFIILFLEAYSFANAQNSDNSSGKSPAKKITFGKQINDLKEKRIALVIGNANYTNGQKLTNPVNDAKLMTKTLKSLGFDIIERIDATKSSMEQAAYEFSKKLPDCNVSLFYYAGHGVQVNGINYLIPVDAYLNERSDTKFQTVSVNYIVDEFVKYPENTNIVIIDACENIPFCSWQRIDEDGFKAISPASGTILSFATFEKSTFDNGERTNGLYTEVLTRQMIISQSIESTFKKTRIELEKLSNNSQSSQEWTKLKGDFWFKK